MTHSFELCSQYEMHSKIDTPAEWRPLPATADILVYHNIHHYDTIYKNLNLVTKTRSRN